MNLPPRLRRTFVPPALIADIAIADKLLYACGLRI